MKPLHINSAAEQVANHLREQLIGKVWAGTMPGGQVLARQLGVGRMTIDTALAILEVEGLLVSQGPSRRRKIALAEEVAEPRQLRVAILLYEQSDETLDYLVDCKNNLEAAGHITFFADSNLMGLKMDVRRISRMVDNTVADAWIVVAGTREVLQWFTQYQTPAFALFGWRSNLKIAGIGPDSLPAVVEVTHRLIDLGHQRIVFLDSLYNLSEPGATGTAFLDELASHAIAVGSYNIPSWQGGMKGLYACLELSFHHTPPTAIIISSSLNYFAVLHFLLNRGIRVPQDISLVCTDEDPSFNQCKPLVSHIRWSSRSVVNRIVRWVNNVSQEKKDIRQTSVKAEFIEGGTIGPVPPQ